MNRKLVSTMLLAAIFVVIAIAGSAYTYYFQGNEIEAAMAYISSENLYSDEEEDLEITLPDEIVFLRIVELILELEFY